MTNAENSLNLENKVLSSKLYLRFHSYLLPETSYNCASCNSFLNYSLYFLRFVDCDGIELLRLSKFDSFRVGSVAFESAVSNNFFIFLSIDLSWIGRTGY
jgi:hypothetical protein